VLFAKPALLLVLDTVEGPAGEHTLEQFWHLTTLADACRFSFTAPARTVESWRSLALCSRQTAPELAVELRGELPARIAMALDLSEYPSDAPLEIRVDGDTVAVRQTPDHEEDTYTF
jgi:hypothetical protein